MLRILLLLSILAADAWSQPIRMRDPVQGMLLVAKRDLPDPNFAETVVLLLDYGRKGAVGLILNRPSQLPVARIFRDMAAAKSRTDTVFSGGPVEPGSVRALQRSKSKLDQARPLIEEVYVVSETAHIEKSFREGTPSSELRFFAGYAGWGPGQLDREIDFGAWILLDADAATIFHAKPESLWDRLIRRSESRMAGWSDQRNRALSGF